jgi:hypothetical protein
MTVAYLCMLHFQYAAHTAAKSRVYYGNKTRAHLLLLDAKTYQMGYI